MTHDAKNPPERFARLAATVRGEVARIARVVTEAENAAKTFAQRTPELLELRGLGDVVHDFYTGLERIFEKIAPELGGGVPAGAAWHRDLLDSMALDIPSVRPPIVSSSTARQLHEFLRFRHLFRHLYGFEIEWPRLEPLLRKLPQTWEIVRADLEQFLSFLSAASEAR